MGVRTCETCTKDLPGRAQCAVLAPRVKENCWAWSDDPDWVKKVQQATQAYQERASGEAG